MLNSSYQKPVTENIQKYIIDVFFSGGKFKKPENRKTVIDKTLEGLGTSTRRQKFFFFMLFQMVIGELGIFPHRFFLLAIL